MLQQCPQVRVYTFSCRFDKNDGAAGTTVIPEFRVEGNYWQVSTDKGATWVDVKWIRLLIIFCPMLLRILQ